MHFHTLLDSVFLAMVPVFCNLHHLHENFLFQVSTLKLGMNSMDYYQQKWISGSCRHLGGHITNLKQRKYFGWRGDIMTHIVSITDTRG